MYFPVNASSLKLLDSSSSKFSIGHYDVEGTGQHLM